MDIKRSPGPTLPLPTGHAAEQRLSWVSRVGDKSTLHLSVLSEFSVMQYGSDTLLVSVQSLKRRVQGQALPGIKGPHLNHISPGSESLGGSPILCWLGYCSIQLGRQV